MKTLKRNKGQRIRIPTSASRAPGLVPRSQGEPAKMRGSWLNAKSMPEPRISKPKPRIKQRPKPRPKRASTNWRAVERRCWLLLGSVFALSVWLSPVTQPAGLQIRGVPAEGQAELKSLLESRWHTPFALNTGYGTLERTLTQLAWIQDAQITPKPDGGLNGVILPRTAVAKVIAPNRVFWLDENGYAFVPPNPKQHRQAKTVRMHYNPVANDGKPVGEKALQRVLECLKQLKTKKLPQKIVFDINLEREICLNIIGLSTGHGLQVRLGDASDVVEQFEVMTQLFRQKPQLLAQCEYLDLQCPTAPAIKRRDASSRDLDSNAGGKKL